MSKSMNMLRTRRRDNNVKPNRRLDRKSSRGMIYENEELRLKTININAEIERGQSDIKKLRRENEMLKKEIWYLRDEYEKLDKLLKQKEVDFSSSSSTCSSDSESSLSEDSKEVETSQNLENVQKTNLKNLHVEFDHLSVVPEEPSTENSDKSRTSFQELEDAAAILQPDQGYPEFPVKKHFFAPLPNRPMTPPQMPHFYTFRNAQTHPSPPTKSPDLIVKMDNHNFTEDLKAGQFYPCPCPESFSSSTKIVNEEFPSQYEIKDFNDGDTCPRSSFSNGGNLEDLLNDIQTISEDILKISSPPPGHYPLERSPFNGHFQKLDKLSNESLRNGPEMASLKPLETDEKYKSEISVVLMPTPMPLIGFEKYKKLSSDNLLAKMPTSQEDLLTSRSNLLDPEMSNSSDQLNNSDKDNELIPSVKISEINDNKDEKVIVLSEDVKDKEKKDKKLTLGRKFSIHFKGRKDKKAQDKKEKLEKLAETKSLPTPSVMISNAGFKYQSINQQQQPDATTVTTTVPILTNSNNSSLLGMGQPGQHSSDSEHHNSKHQNKSTSASPERNDATKKHHKHKKKKSKNTMNSYLKQRRNTLSTDRLHRERSFSICTDRSGQPGQLTDDYMPSSDRERTNSLSSCGTNNIANRRKFSNVSQFPGGSTGGKIPWCACWGNGCI